MKQTNMRMLALCAALCLCVATAAPAYAESTRQTPRTSFVETLLDIPVLGVVGAAVAGGLAWKKCPIIVCVLAAVAVEAVMLLVQGSGMLWSVVVVAG